MDGVTNIYCIVATGSEFVTNDSPFHVYYTSVFSHTLEMLNTNVILYHPGILAMDGFYVLEI